MNKSCQRHLRDKRLSEGVYCYTFNSTLRVPQAIHDHARRATNNNYYKIL